MLPELPVQPAAPAEDPAAADLAERLAALRAARADREADYLLGAVSGRSPHEVDALACALAWRGRTEECDRLLRRCAAGPVERTAGLLRYFAEVGRGWALKLLTAELGRRSAADGSTARVLDALTAFGLGNLADPLLSGASSALPEARVLALAESVDAGGRQAAAFTLYAHASRLLADRWPADRTAGLLRRMTQAGVSGPTERIFDALVEMCGPFPTSTAYMARALTAEGLTEQAKRLIGEVAPGLADAELETLAAYLEAGRLNALAVHALGVAAVGRPARTVIGYCERLYQHNHPDEAAALLVTVASARPVEATALIGALRSAQRSQWADRLVRELSAADPAVSVPVAATLWRGGGREDARSLLAGVARGPLETAASVFAGLDPRPGGPAQALAGLLLERDALEVAQLARGLRARNRPAHADLLLDALTEARPDLVGPVIGHLAAVHPARDAARLLHRFALTCGIGELATVVGRIEVGADPLMPQALAAALARRPDIGEIPAQLRRMGLADHVSRYLGGLGAAMPTAELVALHDDLTEGGQEADADLLLAGCATRADPAFADLCAALHATGRHALAYRLVELRGEFIG